MADIAQRHLRGRAAEEVVAAYLERHGMRVVERNLRVRRLEIDIVARDGSCIVIVEVRTRGAGAWVRSFGSVDGVKRERLRRAAALMWKHRWSRWRGVNRVRFDVAAVDLDADAGPHVEYLRAAF